MKNEMLIHQLDRTSKRITAVRDVMQHAKSDWARNHWSLVLSALVKKFNTQVKEVNDSVNPR